MWYVYVLKCRDGSFYIGFTGNVRKRLYRHRMGLVNWTRSRLPVELVYQETFSTKKEAIEREKKVKTGFERKWLKKIVASRQAGETREKNPPILVIQKPQNPPLIPAKRLSLKPREDDNSSSIPSVEHCPYCKGKDVVKRGLRKKKYESVQLYFCHQCQKTFTPYKVKGKSFPLGIIFEGLSFYNLGYSLEESCQRLKEQFGLEIKSSTLNDWVKEFEPICRYSRLRPYGLKLFSPSQIIQTAHLFHRQVYDFSVHRGKLALLLQEYKNNKFETGEELKFLEDALEGCNKAVVYLEQARDIFIKDIEGRALCDDLIKRYILTRRKIFNLYKAWKRFQKIHSD